MTVNVYDQVVVFVASLASLFRISALVSRQSQTEVAVAGVAAFLMQKPNSTHWVYESAAAGSVAGAVGFAIVHERSPWNSSVVPFQLL